MESEDRELIGSTPFSWKVHHTYAKIMEKDCASSSNTVISCVDIDRPFVLFCLHAPKLTAKIKTSFQINSPIVVINFGRMPGFSSSLQLIDGSTYIARPNGGGCSTSISNIL